MGIADRDPAHHAMVALETPLKKKTLSGSRDFFSAPRARLISSLVAGPQGAIGLDSPDLAYVPPVGRFGQLDPSDRIGDQYVYGRNNPLLFVDPLGLQPEWWENFKAGTWDAAVDYYEGYTLPGIVTSRVEKVEVIWKTTKGIDTFKELSAQPWGLLNAPAKPFVYWRNIEGNLDVGESAPEAIVHSVFQSEPGGQAVTRQWVIAKAAESGDTYTLTRQGLGATADVVILLGSFKFAAPELEGAPAPPFAGGPKSPKVFNPPTNPPQYPVVPAGYVVQKIQRGVVYRPAGSTGNAKTIRIMEPTKEYPNGYWVQYNEHLQPIDPSTGKPGSRQQTHIPLPPKKE